eukprot:scaffold4491_cov90-Alexandrium_tamarense.AAC.1
MQYQTSAIQALRNPSKIAFASLLTAVKGVDPTLFHPTDKLEFIQMVSKVTGIGAGNFFLHTPVDEIVSFFDLKEERVHHTTYKHQECVVHRSTNHQCKCIDTETESGQEGLKTTAVIIMYKYQGDTTREVEC